jgi:site-specific DNA-methyltransferase (adenine-specific)
MSEHIVIVRKKSKTKGRRVFNKEVPAEWWESIWDLAPVPPNAINHPAPFPEDLPHRLIRMLTAPREYVLDPFNGSGTTTKAACDLGRSGIGFDTSSKYRKIAEQRIEEPSRVRSSQLLVLPTKLSEFVPKVRKEAARQGTGKAARKRSRSE